MEDEDLKGTRRDWQDSPNDNDPDNYGLPNVSYDPLEKEDQEYGYDEPKSQKERYYEYEERRSSGFLVFLLIVLLLGGIGFLVYWFQFRETSNEEIVEVEEEWTPPPVIQYEEPVVTDFPLPEPVKTTGELHVMSQRSGSYYVVLGSFIDSDLARDLSKKLNNDGMDTYLLEPLNNRKFYRLGVGNYGSLSEATDKMEELKFSFGHDIWVLKY